MFDIGFLELMITALVGLFIIGPERLPHTIKTGALWIGRIKRNLMETRTEIEKQLGADEIRRELQNEQVMRNLEKMKDSRLELEAKIRQWEQGHTIEQLDEQPTSETEQSGPKPEPEPGPAPAEPGEPLESNEPQAKH